MSGSTSNNLSLQTNGGVMTEYGDEENIAYVATQTGSGRDQEVLTNHCQLLLEDNYTNFNTA